jgi:hypothetical protein
MIDAKHGGQDGGGYFFVFRKKMFVPPKGLILPIPQETTRLYLHKSREIAKAGCG